MDKVDGTNLTVINTITLGDIAIIATVVVMGLIIIAVIATKSK